MPPALQPQTATPIRSYERHVQDGMLRYDEAQRLVIARLQKLHRSLIDFYDTSLLNRLLRLHVVRQPRSLYIWGAVGRGKSLLMDMFYHCSPVHARRVHFHTFMTEIHAAIHAFRRQATTDENPVDHVANAIAERLRLLCLDELEVKDVADAMILSRLFTALLTRGVTCVITSNQPPEALYLGGLQREKFLIFIDFIYERMDVLQLASPHDYRMQQIRALRATYIYPLNDKTAATLQDNFRQLTHHAQWLPATLQVQGRRLLVSQSQGGIAWFSFAELCERPLGAADYMAIARRFHTVFLSGIPTMAAEKRNEARRFVTLIDALYDHRVKLLCTAAAPAAELYAGSDVPEFARTASRLAEMQSEAYLAVAHVP